MPTHNPLIVAFDGDWDLDEITSRATALSGLVGMVKIGKRNFTRHGPEAVLVCKDAGLPVFLDLKYHDIPNTVATSVYEATRLGVTLLTLHGVGGGEMLRRAVAAAKDASETFGVPTPKLLAITVLTSLDDSGLDEVGITGTISEQVDRIARLAKTCGVDGVVASPKEIELIREATDPNFLIVTPGIRPAGQAGTDDQKRVMTPKEAVERGADYLVIGRPILSAADPAKAVAAILAEING